MREKIEFTPDYGKKASNSIIKVIGVGGGGGNAVKHMYSEGIIGVDFLICNTDRQVLESNQVPSKLVLGESGLGAGAKPDVAREYALNSREKIVEFIGKDTKMLFITAGMGKGTGTGAAPVIAQIAKEMGILTIGVVTFPFKFEGETRSRLAIEGIEEMQKYVDSLIVVKNQNIIKYYNDETLDAAFGYADDVLKNAVQCIAELITVNADQNIDFNDIETIMKESGPAMLGLAQASGENRVEEVVEKVLTCPLLNEDLVTNAKNFLFFISYGSAEPLKISELDTLTEKFEHLKTQNSDVIWGHAKDDTLGNAIKLSVIITHYNTREKPNMVNLTDHRQEISSEENRIPGSSHVEDDADNFLENMKKPVDSQSPFNFVEGDRMYIPQNDNVKSNFDVQPRQPDNNIDSSFRFEPQTQTIKNATPTIPQTKPVSTFNDPRYEDNNEFSFLTETPAILRKRRDDQNEIQAMTMTHNIPEFEIEDDTQALFKDIPD
jgi:cell division protein FtsZ